MSGEERGRSRRTTVVELVGPESLRVVERELPALDAGELLVRIEAATTCGTDVKVYRRGGHPRMLRPPCPFGHEFAGTVAEIAPDVERWRLGDRVVVANSASCGRCARCVEGRENLCADLRYLNGAFGERIIVPARFVERSTYRLPDGLPFELASLAEPLACVVHGVEACELVRAADVVVWGAGPIGLLFVGALAVRGHRVVVADPNASRLDVARRFGAADVIAIERGGGQRDTVVARSAASSGFDVAIDATGVPAVWADALASVRPGGLVNLFGGCAPGTTVPFDTHSIHYSELTVRGVYHHRPATFRAAIDLLASRRFDAGLLLSDEAPLAGVEDALRRMMRKEALKVLIRPHQPGAVRIR